MEQAALARRIEMLRSTVDAAGSKTMAILLSLGTIGTYIFIVVASMTHEQLVLQSSVLLPIINTTVPLTWFGVFAPGILFVLTCTAILRATTVHRRLVLLEAEMLQLPLRSERHFQAALIAPLPFVVTSYSNWSTRLLSGIVSMSALCVLPIVVLLCIQARFLPYHSEALTWYHRALVLGAASFVMLLVPVTLLPPPARQRLIILSTVLVAAVVLPAMACSLVICTVPQEGVERYVLAIVPKSWTVASPLRPELRAIKNDRRSGAPTGRPRQMLAVTFLLFEAPTTPFELRRNLRLGGANLVTSRPTEAQIERLGDVQAWREHGRGIKLAGRDLRYSDLSNADLRGADLGGADLTGADLANARLDHTAGDDKTSFEFTRLKSASLRHATLRHTAMRAASLVAADLSHADLYHAYLNSADLRQARFIGTTLSRAELQGADLSDAIFINSGIEHVDARAADFSGAQFVMTTALDVNLAGSTMRNTRGIASLLFGALYAIDARDATSTSWPHLSSTHRAWQTGARITALSQAEIDGLLAQLAPGPFRTEVASKLAEHHASQKKNDEDIGWPGAALQWDDAMFAETLFRLACIDKEAELAVALGVLRKAAVMQADIRSAAASNQSIFNDGQPVAVEPDQLKIWTALEERLADRELCGNKAEIVNRHRTTW